jgi:hypothetical protein
LEDLFIQGHLSASFRIRENSVANHVANHVAKFSFWRVDGSESKESAMARTAKVLRLTALAVKRYAEATRQTAPLHDGDGLYLRKRDASALWYLRLTEPPNGAGHWHCLFGPAGANHQHALTGAPGTRGHSQLGR